MQNRAFPYYIGLCHRRRLANILGLPTFEDIAEPNEGGFHETIDFHGPGNYPGPQFGIELKNRWRWHLNDKGEVL